MFVIQVAQIESQLKDLSSLFVKLSTEMKIPSKLKGSPSPKRQYYLHDSDISYSQAFKGRRLESPKKDIPSLVNPVLAAS